MTDISSKSHFSISDPGILAALSKRLERPASSTPARLSDSDRAAYLAMLKGEHPTPISDDQAHRILDALWAIMVAFVDLGFGLGKPVAGAGKVCGQDGSIDARSRDRRSQAVLSFSHSSQNQNDQAGTVFGTARGKGES